MFTMCPNCHRIYDVPAEKIKPGRQSFHCMACDFTFEQQTQSEEEPDIVQETPVDELTPQQTPAQPDQLDTREREEAATASEEEPRPDFGPKLPSFLTDNPLSEPLPETPDAFEPVTQRAPKHRIRQGAGWILTAVVLLISLLIVGRYDVVRHFPAIQPVYTLIGLETEPLGNGLDFKDTFFDIMREDGVQTLLVKGTVVNVSDTDKKMPFIWLILTDEAGNITEEQTLAPVKETIAPGEVLPFETKIKPMNRLTRQIEVTFKKTEGA